MEGNEKQKKTKKDNGTTGFVKVEVVKEFFQKQFGPFKGGHFFILGIVVIILIIGLALNKNSVSKGEYPEYSMVYQNADGELKVIAKNQKEGIKISSDSETRDVIYANKTNRYILFEKNNSLYLYDSKKKDDTTKILSDVVGAYFTPNDKYVVALDTEGHMYSYNYKKDKEKLDSDVTSIKDCTDTKVLYVKDGSLYIRSLNAKKDDKVKIEDSGVFYASISEDGKRVVYITEKDKDLKYYIIGNGKTDKIDSDVVEYYCDTTCKHMYYVTNDSESKLYYYNGKEGEKVASDVYEIVDVDVLNKQVVYAKEDDKEFTLYYKKAVKGDEVKIDDSLEKLTSAYIYNGKGIYYINDDSELKYAKINGSKIGDVKTVVEDAIDGVIAYKKGIILVADTDKRSNGDLYFVSGSKGKKVDSDVYSSYLKVSINGNRVFYLKDYSSNSGDLYTTTGGKGKKIDSDVYRYVYVNDKTVYYLKDFSSSKKYGDMYLYNGSKGKKVVEDVTSMATNKNYYKVK